MSHTPGPWIAKAADSSTENHPFITNYFILTPAGMTMDAPWIATVEGVHVGEKDQSINEANARLIAAAPMLLKALEYVLCVRDIKCTYHPKGDLSCARCQADLAIAEATGGAE